MALVPDAQNNMQERFDKLAILLSGLCAIHCIVTPIIASIIPLFAATIHHGENIHEFWFHQFILLFILPVSLIALFTGYRSHHKMLPIYIAGLGLLILTLIALFAESLLHSHIISHEGETLLTISGGIVHAIGHILNVMATRRDHTHCSLT